MGVIQKFISLTDYYKSIPGDKFILNDYSLFDFNHAKEFYRAMVTEYEDETMILLPKCRCGHLVGQYYEGTRCPKCDGLVADKAHDPVVWAEAFSKDLLFINPAYYYMLNQLLSRDIPYLTGITKEPRVKNSIANALVRNVMNGERTYKDFVANIRNILVYLTNLSGYRQGKKGQTVLTLLRMWDEEKDKILSSHIPMINNMLFNVTKTNKGKFVDIGLGDVFDAASQWMRISNDYNATDKQKDICTAKVVSILGSMVGYYIKIYLSKKSGIFRKHVYGARSPFTFRTVIVSRPGKHQHDEIEVPWVTGLSVFRPHVLNKLINKHGFSHRDASDLIFKSCKKYHPLLAELMQELINEAKEVNGRGIPVIGHRNPTLLQGSAQLLYIVKFKDNPMDNTTAFSVLVAKSPNADYDGDDDFINHNLKAG